MSAGLKCQLSTNALDTNITGKTTQCKYFFNDNTTTEYRDNLTSLFTNEFVHSFALEIDNDTNSIDHITEKFTNILKECGQCCQRTLEFCQNKQPPWFDVKCKTLKTEKHCCFGSISKREVTLIW